MCNHYSSSGEYRDRMGEFSELRLPVFRDRGRPNSVKEHVYPARDGEILFVEDGELVNAAAHWRFVPPFWRDNLKEWAKDSKPGAFRGKGCNNARIEGLDGAKSMFRTGARCLIPTDAFFEYGKDRGPAGKLIEYRFSHPAGEVLWLAGICGWAEPAEGRTLTFTMVTKPPGGDTASIKHHRQPVNLVGEQVSAWLDPSSPLSGFSEVSPVGAFSIEPSTLVAA